MAHDTELCSKCKNPLSFKRVDVDLNLDASSKRGSLEILDLISLCNEDLSDYDAEIIRLQNQILHLQAQKKRSSDYKAQLQSFLFRKLPNEILCIIFESACTENLLQEYPWPLAHVRPPTALCLPAITYLPALAISAVCTRWRSLALASPRLWSHLRLETSCFRNEGVSTLRLYLDRSADAPLSISVATQGTIYYEYSPTSPALDLLLDHTNRWKSFRYTGDYQLKVFIGLHLSFPILENLTLEDDGELVTIFKHAPKLLTVATRGHITDLPRSWNHLTSLQILRATNRVDISSLTGHSDLSDLKLLSPWNGFGTGITSLARLKSFSFVESLSEQKDTMLSDMFSSMTLPSLTELLIDSRNVRPRLIWPPDIFSAFISRSTCILTTLSLRRVSISDRSLIAAFHILPSLVNFFTDCELDSYPLTNSPITSHFILSMSASSPTPVLPKLRSLSITTDSPSFDDAAFVDMVSSRWLPASEAAAIGIDCLRSLVLHFPGRKLDEESYRSLESLERMGMQVVVTGKHGS